MPDFIGRFWNWWYVRYWRTVFGHTRVIGERTGSVIAVTIAIIFVLFTIFKFVGWETPLAEWDGDQIIFWTTGVLLVLFLILISPPRIWRELVVADLVVDVLGFGLHKPLYPDITRYGFLRSWFIRVSSRNQPVAIREIFLSIQYADGSSTLIPQVTVSETELNSAWPLSGQLNDHRLLDKSFRLADSDVVEGVALFHSYNDQTTNESDITLYVVDGQRRATVKPVWKDGEPLRKEWRIRSDVEKQFVANK